MARSCFRAVFQWGAFPDSSGVAVRTFNDTGQTSDLFILVSYGIILYKSLIVSA